eukprot:m.756763 g.756763  ORF g.756763 m.756763 type:complete len:607 (+) comp23185_c0_seq3:84-1904(+)
MSRSVVCLTVLTLSLSTVCSSNIADENTMVWPQPQSQSVGPKAGYVAVPPKFSFVHAPTSAASASSILAAAFKRYEGICFQHRPEPITWIGRCDASPCPPNPLPPDRSLSLEKLSVHVLDADETLGMSTLENYTLTISFYPQSANLSAQTIYGAIHGLETFSQLIQPDYSIREQVIVDYPRFPHRSVLIDSARHFLPVPLLFAHLDAMAYNKMNVLHWHIVDMPSFPYESVKFPDMSKNGAFDENHTYSPSDIQSVIQYAKYRGIRVIPEFDVPGHTFPAWDRRGVLHQNSTLLTKCAVYDSVGGYGPLRADLEATYTVLETLFSEVAEAFPDQVFNMGGDEVHPECWEQNEDVATYLKLHNMTGSDLGAAFTKRVMQFIDATLKKTAMMWRPGIGDSVALEDTPADMVYDVYGPMQVTPWPEKPVTIGYNESATYTTKYGHYVVRSANYYLDQFCTADPDNKHYGTYWGYWQGWEYYNVDPVHGEIDVAAGGRPELVIGGCANMWGEHVDATNFMPRVWPRTSTMAERFWSAATVNDSDTARPRLHEFRCKMVRRGIPAEPIASLSYNEGGPYHVAFCKHDSDWYEYRPPQPWYNGSWAIYPKHV